MRRAHYLVICGVVASAAAAYLLGSGSVRGGRDSGEWCAPVRAADQGAPRGARRAVPSGPAEQLAIRLLAGRYGIAEPAVAQAVAEGLSLEDTALAANLAARVGRPFDEVCRYKRDGEAWDAVARRFGVDASRLPEPVQAPLAANDEALFREVLGRRYRLPELAVAKLRRDGFSAAEITVAAALTGGGEAEVTAALYARRHGQGWQSAITRPADGREGHQAAAPGQARGEGEGQKQRDTADDAAYCRALLSGYYGIRAQEIEAGARRGLPWTDLLIAANAAARSGRAFGQVVGLRGEGLSWSVVEQRVGLGAGDALKLPAPSVHRAAEKPAGGSGRARD